MIGITPKTKNLLKLCERPSRFVDLLRGTGFTTEGLSSALRRLQERGIIKKLEDGRYVLTDKGRSVLETIKLIDGFFELLEITKIDELREMDEEVYRWVNIRKSFRALLEGVFHIYHFMSFYRGLTAKIPAFRVEELDSLVEKYEPQITNSPMLIKDAIELIISKHIYTQKTGQIAYFSCLISDFKAVIEVMNRYIKKISDMGKEKEVTLPGILRTMFASLDMAEKALSLVDLEAFKNIPGLYDVTKDVYLTALSFINSVKKVSSMLKTPS